MRRNRSSKTSKNWWIVHASREESYDCQLLTQIQDLQNKVNSLSDAREFCDPETVSSSGTTHVPSQPSTIPRPRTLPCRDSGLPHDTRTTTCSRKTNFYSLQQFKEFRVLFSRMETWRSRKYKATESEMRREPKNSSTLVPLFQSGGGL